VREVSQRAVAAAGRAAEQPVVPARGGNWKAELVREPTPPSCSELCDVGDSREVLVQEGCSTYGYLVDGNQPNQAPRYERLAKFASAARGNGEESGELFDGKKWVTPEQVEQLVGVQSAGCGLWP